MLLGHFAGLGYFERPSLDLITLNEFNDGLRYDDTTGAPNAGKAMWLQTCGRVEDIATKGGPGVLAGFHMFALRNGSPAFEGELLNQVLAFLTRRAGLPPSRLVLVSTEWFAPYKAVLAPYGIAPDQVVLRPVAEAMAAGDGSGHFSPKGHNLMPQVPTVSIHFVTDGGPASGRRYPLSGAIELAEISLRAGPKRDMVSQESALGLDRLLMAQGKTVDDFDQSRRKLLRAISDEAKRRGVPVPEAYGTFEAA